MENNELDIDLLLVEYSFEVGLGGTCFGTDNPIGCFLDNDIEEYDKFLDMYDELRNKMYNRINEIQEDTDEKKCLLFLTNGYLPVLRELRPIVLPPIQRSSTLDKEERILNDAIENLRLWLNKVNVKSYIEKLGCGLTSLQSELADVQRRKEEERKDEEPNNLSNQSKDYFIEGLKFAVEKTNIDAQLSNFNEALKQGLPSFEELVARSFLMRYHATREDLEEANKEARRAREIYGQLQETFQLRDNPAKGLFLNGYRRAPVYPESIRDDWPEEERKQAALEMMREYHEVFIEPKVLHFYLGECYLERGEIDLAILESEKAIHALDEEDPPIDSVIFHTRLGTMYKEKGDFASAASEFRKAIDAYSIDDLPSNELLAEKFRDGMSFWMDKAKQLLAEKESIISQQERTGVEIEVGFFPLSFFFFVCIPRIEIDGRPHKKYWGTHFFELDPGKHTIKIYFRYLFMSQCGANSIDVVVKDGETCRVKYNMPPWMFSKGSIKQI